ncbi:MAG: hypothetical protein L6Q76_03400 [Polyangiaceae bacterium]|nr:hypothetical protein [Polyangiaceae bacterium]
MRSFPAGAAAGAWARGHYDRGAITSERGVTNNSIGLARSICAVVQCDAEGRAVREE